MAQTDNTYSQNSVVDITIKQLNFAPYAGVKMIINTSAEIDYYEEDNLPPSVHFTFGEFFINNTPIFKYFEDMANTILAKEPEFDLSDEPKYCNEEELSELIIELSTLIQEWFWKNGFLKAMDDEAVEIESL